MQTVMACHKKKTGASPLDLQPLPLERSRKATHWPYHFCIFHLTAEEGVLLTGYRLSDAITSVVTISKFSLAVGFGTFCGNKPRFWIRFRFLDEIVVNLNFECLQLLCSISILRAADSHINTIVHTKITSNLITNE